MSSILNAFYSALPDTLQEILILACDIKQQNINQFDKEIINEWFPFGVESTSQTASIADLRPTTYPLPTVSPNEHICLTLHHHI